MIFRLYKDARHHKGAPFKTHQGIILWEGGHIFSAAAETGKYLNEKLKNALEDHPNVVEIRRIGLINAIELVKDKKSKKSFDAKKRIGYEIYKNALDNWLVLRPLGDVIYFNPPLIISKDEALKAVNLCRVALEKICQELKALVKET